MVTTLSKFALSLSRIIPASIFISEEKEVAKKRNTFFNNAVKSLGISENQKKRRKVYSVDNPRKKLTFMMKRKEHFIRQEDFDLILRVML